MAEDAASELVVGDQVKDLSKSDVVAKYQEAARICNLALSGVLQMCQPGANISDICTFGDSVIIQSCGLIYRNKVKGRTIEKGVAFPTCVSVNECVCNNSPLGSEATRQPPLSVGDIAKIEVGCHIDGFIAVAAHTYKVGAQPTKEIPVSGKEADVILACYQAAELAALSIIPGNTNTQVEELVNKVAKAYQVNIVAGCKMHQMKQYIINGAKTIVPREDDTKADPATFEVNEVYAVNVLVSSGEGKPKEGEQASTIFKRAVDKRYQLKMNASRVLFNQVNKQFPTLPFSLRALENERQARLGVKECVTHELLEPFKVLYGHTGEIFAHAKYTVLVLPSGPVITTGRVLDYDSYLSDKVMDDELKSLLVAAKERENARVDENKSISVNANEKKRKAEKKKDKPSDVEAKET